jgi:hypothetical protein
VYTLAVHADAKEDLDLLRKQDPATAARIVAVLQEIQSDQGLLDALTAQDYGAYGSKPIHVTKVQKLWQAGADIWRLKIWELENQGIRQRIIYAYLPRKGAYFVLGVIPRSHAYDTTHPRIRRIIETYEDLVS